MPKNIFFPFFFLITCRPEVHNLRSFVLKFYLQALFQSAQHIYEKKREGSGHGSVPLTNDPDPDPGGPKTCGSCGSGSRSGSGSGSKHGFQQGVTKRCRLSLLTNCAPRIRVPMRGEGGVCGVSANEYSCAHITWHGAQIKFGDLPPYLTYGFQSSFQADIKGPSLLITFCRYPVHLHQSLSY